MKKFLLGFAEEYFIVSLMIYIATYLILKNLINTLFYPILFGLGYQYKQNMEKEAMFLRNYFRNK